MNPSRPTRLRAGVLAAAVALSGVGLATATSAAHAAEPTDPAPSATCPAAFTGTFEPGDEVSGLTTTRGTTPEKFTGTYVDDLDGGILLFELEGSRITKPDGSIDAGVWAGMSGSPVYAKDGSLVGAVAYSVGGNGQALAGITPAADLYAVGADDDAMPEQVSLAPARRSLAQQRISTSARSLDRLDSGPVVTSRSALHFSMLKKIARRAGLDGRTLRRGGVGASGSGFQGSAADITPGAAIGLSYTSGDVDYSYGGTATAVCGSRVFSFGHTADGLGDTISAALRPASVPTIVKDAYADFGADASQLSKLGQAVGRYTQDRFAGQLALTGATGPTTAISSRSTFGTKVHEGASTVYQPEALAFTVADQAVTDYLTTRDAALGGTASLGWRITFDRAGKTQVFERSGFYSSRDVEELIYGLTEDVASDVYEIAENDAEPVEITSVQLTNALSKEIHSSKIAVVQTLNRKGWTTVSSKKVLDVSRQNTLRVRVKLVPTSRFSADKERWVNLPFIAPTKSTRPTGVLTVAGEYVDEDEWSFDDDYEFDEDYVDEEGYGEDLFQATTLDGLLKELQAQPRADQVSATLSYKTPRGTRLEPFVRRSTGSVVQGGINVPIRFVR